MAHTNSPSPRINHLSWGHMDVAGIGVGKDFKLWPGGGREWDWRETNTHHDPGIQPADVEELLGKGSKTIVLSRGMLLMLQTCQETLDLLEQKKINVHVEETKAAAQIYNDLASRGEPVGGLFHSTC
ncbi:MAG: Mth938-like domain-containing protein [Arenicellales bacterium]|nr:Mth938-like domain-containing protein [Arenicellales bacterium]